MPSFRFRSMRATQKSEESWHVGIVAIQPAGPASTSIVTERIIASLKGGVIPWGKPWKTPHFTVGPFPRNFCSGKPCRGINVLLLWSSEYNSPFWLTFKQAQALKGDVRKGEHGIQIVLYKQLPEYARTDEEVKRVVLN